MIKRVACFNGRIPVDRVNSSTRATMSTEKSAWVLTVDKEFDCWQEANRKDRYAVAVYGHTQSSTWMYSAWIPSSSNFVCILHVLGA